MMNNGIPPHLIHQRIRWRLIMLVMQGLLMVFSFAMAGAMMFPTFMRPASTQYYLIMVMLIMMGCYGSFGLVVYCRCRFLLRVLSIVSAVILGVLIFQFIMSFVSSLTCRYDEGQTRTQLVPKQNCTGGERVQTSHPTLECRLLKSRVLYQALTKRNCSAVDFWNDNLQCQGGQPDEALTSWMNSSTVSVGAGDDNDDSVTTSIEGANVTSHSGLNSKWESNGSINSALCYSQNDPQSFMICRVFQATFQSVILTPQNCTSDSTNANQAFECRMSDDTGWVPTIVSEKQCPFSSGPPQPLSCIVHFYNKTNCPPLPQFWDTIGDQDVGTRVALLPVGCLYTVVCLLVLIMTLWHSVDEVRFGQCLCGACDAMAATSMIGRHNSNIPAHIFSAQPVTCNQQNTSTPTSARGSMNAATQSQQHPMSTLSAIQGLAKSQLPVIEGVTKCTQSASWSRSFQSSQLPAGQQNSSSVVSHDDVADRNHILQCFPSTFLTEPLSWGYTCQARVGWQLGCSGREREEVAQEGQYEGTQV